MRAIDADLHLHSTASDGTLPPAQVVALAAKRGLRALALTDHDTLDGLVEARRAAEAADLDFIDGVEMSCDVDGADIHVLAYFVDERNADFAGMLAGAKERRIARGRDMVTKLNALGVAITYDAVAREAAKGAVGRPHVARALVAAKAVGSVDEAFYRYLRLGAAAYVPKVSLSSRDVIDLTRRAGGAAVLAHPGLYRGEGLIQRLASEGIAGLEVWHSKHSDEQMRRFEELARELRLVPTGGSDFHDPAAGDILPGTEGVPLATIDRLRAATG